MHHTQRVTCDKISRLGRWAGFSYRTENGLAVGIISLGLIKWTEEGGGVEGAGNKKYSRTWYVASNITRSFDGFPEIEKNSVE